MTQGLDRYAQALRAHRLGKPKQPADAIEIRQGYQPGVIGRVAEMHARFGSSLMTARVLRVWAESC